MFDRIYLRAVQNGLVHAMQRIDQTQRTRLFAANQHI